MVLLKKQIQVVDPVWQEYPVRLRFGEVIQKDLDMLRTLILGKGGPAEADNETDKCSHSYLVTPRHGVKMCL